MSDSPNNNIPYVPQNTLDPAAGLNDAIRIIDALLNSRVQSMGTNSPPGSPTDGEMYVVGSSPTGAWAGESNAIAQWNATGTFWTFYAAGVQAWLILNLADDNIYKWNPGSSTWILAAGIGDAPDDGNFYGRKNLGWSEMPDVNGLLTNPMTQKGSLIIGGALDTHDAAGHGIELAPGSSGQALRMLSGAPAWAGDSFIVSLMAGNASTGNDATNKRQIGGISFDPTDAQWGITDTSTIKLQMLLATTAGANVANADLFKISGTGSPVVSATTSTVSSTSVALVTTDVSAIFRPSGSAGIWIPRIWITTNNGIDECSCLGAWLEIKR